jgi:Uncharacterised protein family (UPF0175)
MGGSRNLDQRVGGVKGTKHGRRYSRFRHRRLHGNYRPHSDLARRLGTVGEIERRALEALALEEFKLVHLTKPELRRLLGFGTRMKLDEFLKTHEMYQPYTLDDLEREREDLTAIVPDEESRARARQAAANIIARRKGVSLGRLSIKDLINEGRR